MSLSILSEVRNLPQTVDPNWLATVEQEEDENPGPPLEQERPLTPTQAKAKAERY